MNLRAFTLIETVVVIAITSVVIGVLGTLLVNLYRTNAYVYEQAAATTEARRGIDSATKDLREAVYGSDGSYPIQSAATSSVSFFADINNDQVNERVTYAATNSVLTRTAVGASTVTNVLASSIINDASTPIFRYFDAAGTELTEPIQKEQIASVTTTLVIKLNANRGPTPLTLLGRATLRNNKNKP